MPTLAAQHAISLLNTIELQRNIPAWDYEGTAIRKRWR